MTVLAAPHGRTRSRLISLVPSLQNESKGSSCATGKKPLRIPSLGSSAKSCRLHSKLGFQLFDSLDLFARQGYRFGAAVRDPVAAAIPASGRPARTLFRRSKEFSQSASFDETG